MSSAEKDSPEVGNESLESTEKVEESLDDSEEKTQEDNTTEAEDSSDTESEHDKVLPDEEESTEVALTGEAGSDGGDEELEEEEAPMTFLEHLEELRRRFLKNFYCLHNRFSCMLFICKAAFFSAYGSTGSCSS